MFDTTIDHVKELRKNITSEFHDWYADAVMKLGVKLMYHVLQGNNTR